MTPLPPRRRHRRGAGPLVLAATFVAGAVGVGGTAALWSSGSDTPLGAIVAGDLDLELVGPTVWLDASPGLTGPARQIDPAEFLVRPGDTLTARQEFTTALRGDHLNAVLTVGWDRLPALPTGAEATYTVRDQTDTAVASDVPLGTATSLPALDADSGGRADDFTLEVTIDLAGSADRFGADAAPEVADLGAIVLTLDQVRPGEESAS